MSAFVTVSRGSQTFRFSTLSLLVGWLLVGCWLVVGWFIVGWMVGLLKTYFLPEQHLCRCPAALLGNLQNRVEIYAGQK